MKAKIIETGEIVDVTPYPTWYKEDGQGPDRREWDEDELDFSINSKSKEVDLEKEIDKIWNPRFNLGWDDRSLLSINHEGFTTIAKYFYELGLKVRKEE